jgi:VIT1/CCC1 family predicted Fe2+/Mn2+ transporter
MRDYGMFSKQGNAAVQKIVDEAIALYEVSEYGLETVWNWACNELEALGRLEGCEEATDTAVREAVYNAII